MPSQDSFFKVKTGLGVGTDTLYASVGSKNVSIGATTGPYSLNVYGTVYSDNDVLVDNSVGIGTTVPFQRLDVRGIGIFSDSVGIGTTLPVQTFQVNGSQGTRSVVVTGLGSFGIGTLYPYHPFEYVGAASTGIECVVIDDLGYVGVGTYLPKFNVDVSGDVRVSGFATITNAFVGVATIGFATITNAFVGVATIRTATIGFATITDENVGFSTIGFATITNAFVGVATIRTATIGFATITDENVGFSTIKQLLVTEITTTAKLDVGIGATLAKFDSFSTTSVTDLSGNLIKTIKPIVGINTTLPTRTLDIAGDLRVRGEVVDSGNNVGFAYSVLSSDGNNIPDRFVDAANILVRNKDFIAAEIVGFITSTDGPFGANGPLFDYGTVGPVVGRETCSRDIKLIVDAIAFDISKGGNSKCVGAGLSYYNGVTLSYLGDTDPLPPGFDPNYVKNGTLAGISSIANFAKYIINNAIPSRSYQFGDYYNRNSDAANLITANKNLIAEVAVNRMLAQYPGFSVPNGNQNCIDDIAIVLENLCYNLQRGGNDKVYDAANLYVTGAHVAGEEQQSIYAFNQARDMAIQAMRNQTIATSSTFDTTNYDRNSDAANLITANKNLIAEVAVNRMLAQYPGFSVPNGNQNCIDDIAIVLDQICYNLKRGGNDKVYDAANLYVTGSHVAGENAQSIYAFNQARDMAIQAMRNETIATSSTFDTTNYDRNSDAANLITANKNLIAEVAVARMLAQYPGFSVPNGNQNCIDDIAIVLDQICYNLKRGGNDKVYDAANLYITGAYVAGETAQSNYAFNQARDMAIQAMRNQTITITGSSRSQVKDLTITVDSNNPTCANVASAITTLTSIVTQAVTTGSISNITKVFPGSTRAQIKDQSITVDSNNPTCANVASAITTLTSIVTQAIGSSGVGNLNGITKVFPGSTRAQVKDQSITVDSDSPTCANVASAITTLISIVTQAIGNGNRNSDAVNLITANKNLIAEVAVNRMLAQYPGFSVPNGNQNCIDDIAIVLDQICYNLKRGGNDKVYDAANLYVTGAHVAGEEQQSIYAFNQARDMAIQAMRNQTITITGSSRSQVKDLTITVDSNNPTCANVASAITTLTSIVTDTINNGYINSSDRNSDAANLITANKNLIAEVAVNRMLSEYPGFSVPNGNQNCIDDIAIVLDQICYNLQRGGNDKVYDAANLYVTGAHVAGENAQSIYAFNQARDMAIQAMRNETITITGSSRSQVKDLTITVDSSNPTCANVASAITTLTSIVTQAIGSSGVGNLNGITRKTSIIRTTQSIGDIVRVSPSFISQVFDLTILPDQGSNTNPNGCANVTSSIYSCVGIITSIISNGRSAAPSINYPIGNLVWKPPGAKIGNEWFVNKFGNDDNQGKSPGDAFLTIKKACSLAQPGDTVRVYTGLYVEDGPIQLAERVAVVGEDLRRTLVTTREKTDLYHVRRGCYVAQQSFVGPSNPNAMVSFPTQGFGFANGTEKNWQSPYIQNCTNFVPDSIGMRIDGDRAGGFKSMVLDAYTQYNQGGIGVSITNFGYAQLVSLFTICCDIAVFCDSGGVCDLNNSNVSFGNFALVSNGSTPLQYTGTVVQAPVGDNVDSLVINVGNSASNEFLDSAELLRLNKDFISSEAVEFMISNDGPFGVGSTYFDYGGSPIGKTICKRDSEIILECIASDIISLGNLNCINAGLSYRDSPDRSITYLPETFPPPGNLQVGYIQTAELALIEYIAEISKYVIRNEDVPKVYNVGVGSFPQIKDLSKLYSPLVDSFIESRAGIITSIIGTGSIPEKILPKGQRPYDGQISYIDTQYYFVREIVIDNPGSGYDPSIPVNVFIDFPENSEYFIPAEAAIFETNVNSNGTIGSIDMIVTGTGYLETPPNVTIDPPATVGGVQATARAVMEKYFFNPVSSTPVVSGITTVTFDQFITYSPLIGVGSTVYFYQSSKVIASGITFEYVGTGINIVDSIPSKGAVPINENQIVATNGGKVPFTSTDQGGNFRISEGITINQNTGTITGQAFSKSLQAEVTPLIIALQR